MNEKKMHSNDRQGTCQNGKHVMREGQTFAHVARAPTPTLHTPVGLTLALARRGLRHQLNADAGHVARRLREERVVPESSSSRLTRIIPDRRRIIQPHPDSSADSSHPSSRSIPVGHSTSQSIPIHSIIEVITVHQDDGWVRGWCAKVEGQGRKAAWRLCATVRAQNDVG